MKRTSGFTLIELLVVIAIIGILSSVVFSSLSSARKKGANTGIRTAFAQLRNEGNIYFNDMGGFGTTGNLCTTVGSVFVHPRFVKIINSAETLSGSSAVCRNTSTAWAVSILLKQPEGVNNYLCADSSGALGGHPTALASGVTVCP